MSLVLTDGARTIEAVGGDPGPAGGWFLVGHRAGISGWWDGPGVRRATTARPLAHGNFPAPGYRSGRGIGLSLGLVATSRADLEAKRALVLSMLADGGDGTLTVSTEEGESLSATVGLGSGPLTREVSTLGMVAQVELYAPDPLRYAAPVSVSTGFPVLAGGLEYDLYTDGAGTDLGYLDFGAASETGRIVVTNTGTAPAPITFQVEGAVAAQGFEVVQVDGPGYLRFTGPNSATSVLVLDGATGNVLVDGDSDRGGLLTGRAWPVVPAATHVAGVLVPGAIELAFINLGASSDARLTAVVRPGSW